MWTPTYGRVQPSLVLQLPLEGSSKGYGFTASGTFVNKVSKLQNIVAVSTMEAEYVVAIEASKEIKNYHCLRVST